MTDETKGSLLVYAIHTLQDWKIKKKKKEKHQKSPSKNPIALSLPFHYSSDIVLFIELWDFKEIHIKTWKMFPLWRIALINSLVMKCISEEKYLRI